MMLLRGCDRTMAVSRLAPGRPERRAGRRRGSASLIVSTRASGGIGRRAGFRFLCPKGCGGSSPPSPTPRSRRPEASWLDPNNRPARGAKWGARVSRRGHVTRVRLTGALRTPDHQRQPRTRWLVREPVSWPGPRLPIQPSRGQCHRPTPQLEHPFNVRALYLLAAQAGRQQPAATRPRDVMMQGQRRVGVGRVRHRPVAHQPELTRAALGQQHSTLTLVAAVRE